MKVVALAGGTGAAKFLRGLVRVMPPADLTIIGNTGDDLELFGLSISPDLDTVAYTLAGLVDESKGWGVKQDTFFCRQALERFGETTYFALGDQDLAIHLWRSDKLRQGVPLSRVTRELTRRLGLACRLLPMSDEPVRTRVLTPGGWLAFQEFFVRDRCQPEVLDIEYVDADRARPGAEVLEAIAGADAIVICPSNPISSVGPIVAVPGIRRALVERRDAVTAISPIIGESPVSGPAGKMMHAKGFPISVIGVAQAYGGFLGRLFIDERDRAAAPILQESGVRAIVADITMNDRDREIALARTVLEALS
jgi:LPPG:FO 2-phospho-L-lactate transferase